MSTYDEHGGPGDEDHHTSPDEPEEKTGDEFSPGVPAGDTEVSAAAGAGVDTGAGMGMGPAAKTDTSTGKATDASADVGTTTHPKTGTDMGTGTETDAETGTDPQPRPDRDTETETGPGTKADTDAGVGAGTRPKTGTDADAATDAGTDADTDADTDVGAGTETDNGTATNTSTDPDPTTATTTTGTTATATATTTDPDHDSPRTPRIPLPRASVEDGGGALPDDLADLGAAGAPPALEHRVLKSLLGAWALAACSPQEAGAVEEHLGTCGTCADEALRLRGAVGLLHPPETLDLDPALRTRVLDHCLDRRPPRIPVPPWAKPYDAEAARLDALLQDFGDAEWHAPVRLRWFDGTEATSRRTTVAGVIAHLLAVDGLIALALGLKDPLGTAPEGVTTPAARTEAYWRASHFPPTRSVRGPWREQVHGIVRTAAFTGGGAGKLAVSYGDFVLPLHDAMTDRAFECWVHAEDIAEAVDYPYDPPSPRYLHGMIDLAVRMLPSALAARRQAGLSAPPGDSGRHLVTAGEPGRSLRLEIEGLGGGEWMIPLDSPGAVGSTEHEVAHVALDGVEFCHLAAGRVPPEEAVAGQLGDRAAIREVLFATAGLSRL